MKGGGKLCKKILKIIRKLFLKNLTNRRWRAINEVICLYSGLLRVL